MHPLSSAGVANTFIGDLTSDELVGSVLRVRAVTLSLANEWAETNL